MLPALASVESMKPGDPASFTGDVSIGLVAGTTDTTLHLYEVHFAARARTRWHSHSGEQILLGLRGRCVMQVRGERPVAIPEKSAVRIPPGVVHWHGALEYAASHLAVNIATETTWLDPVSEAEYDAASADAHIRSNESGPAAQGRGDGRR